MIGPFFSFLRIFVVAKYEAHLARASGGWVLSAFQNCESISSFFPVNRGGRSYCDEDTNSTRSAEVHT
jgi:hypothetical protein